MKGRCSRESPEGHDTAHCALGSMYASVAVTVRLLGYNVPRPSEFAPCNPAQLDSVHFWLFEGRVGARAGGSARCRTVGDLGSRVKRAVSGVVPADRDRVPHASAPRPQLGTNFQECKAACTRPFLREKKKKRIGLRREAWWRCPAAKPPIQLHNPRSYWRGCKQDGIARGSAQRCCPSSRRRKRSLSLVRTCFTCMLPAPPGAFALAQGSLALGLL